MDGEVIPRVSIVVASHRPAFVEALAATLCECEQEAQIIVVADYDVQPFAKRFPAVTWISHRNTGIPVKRNAGVAAARAEIVGFTDDDCVPEPGWTWAAVHYLDSHPKAGGVEGKTIIDASNRADAPLSEFKRLERRGFRTNNIFYRKRVLEAAGRFDERFTVQREDADLAFTVLALGFDIGYCESAIVTHRVRHGERWDLLKNCVNRRFDPLLFKKHPLQYRKHVGSPFTPAIGLVLFCHVVLSLSLVVAPVVWPIVLAVDATVALALSVRRNTHGKNCLSSVVRDWLLFLASPFVLASALVYGSTKFGKWLLF